MLACKAGKLMPGARKRARLKYGKLLAYLQPGCHLAGALVVIKPKFIEIAVSL